MAKRRPRARAPELRGEAGEAGEAQAVPAATRRAPAEDPARYPDPPRKPKAHPRASALVDTRVIYCGDNLDQLRKFPDACVDLIYIDPPFNSNRNYEVFWGETREKRAFEDRHASTQAYIEFMRPRCVKLYCVQISGSE